MLPTENCRYFLSYTGVKLPLSLLQELHASQLQNRISYFKAIYNAEKQLITVQKMVYGEIEMQHRYQYRADGTLQQAEVVDVDGEATVMLFDGIGNPVK